LDIGAAKQVAKEVGKRFPMSFENQLEPHWAAPGDTLYWHITFGDNRGIQFIEADVKTPNSQMMSIEQGRKLEVGGAVTYFVTIRNDGPEYAYYNLMGGGGV
jgi:hypothetical protein